MDKSTIQVPNAPVRENSSFLEYEASLKLRLKPVLEAILISVIQWRPEDAISFIAMHLRHLRVDENYSLRCTQPCAVCEALVLQQKTDEQVIGEILTEDIMKTTWQQVDIITAWETLQTKYGKQVQWWHVAGALASQTSSQPIQPLPERAPSFSIILFLSSTFSDMHDERDYIVQHVVEELQEACDRNALDLHIMPIDLRWGVASDTSFEVCMNQIKRCREQNVMPYFLCLLGDRYGFVPTNLPNDLRQEYCFIPGMSMTAAEICTGAVWMANPNALFLIRESQVIDKALSRLSNEEDVQAVFKAYRGTDADKMRAIGMLKMLVRKYMPGQVMDYTCEVEQALEAGIGEEKKSVFTKFRCADGSKLGKYVVDFFMKRIVHQYPPMLTGPGNTSVFVLQRKQHLSFINLKSDHERTGRKEEAQAIRSYIENDVAPKENVPILVLHGLSGVGKSSLMANMAADYSDKQKADSNEMAVFVHFVGVAPNSTSLEMLLKRLWFECLNCPEDYIPSDIFQLKFSFDSVLARASERITNVGLKRLVIFLDALNQLDEEYDALTLNWLPKVIPHNVRLVVSLVTQPDDAKFDIPQQFNVKLLEIPILRVQKRVALIENFLRPYGKTLTDEQMQTLVAKRDSGLPLWLTLACEEIRVYGRFPSFNNKIRSLGDDLNTLLMQIITRLINELPNYSDYTKAAWILICVSQYGLTESELQELLAIEPTIPVAEGHASMPSKPLSMETWLEMYLNVSKLLLPVHSAVGPLDFYHMTSRNTIEALFLQDETVKRIWHKRLAYFFENSKSVSMGRKVSELPFHYEFLNDWGELQRFFMNYSVFELLERNAERLSFAARWKKITGCYYLVARHYEHALREFWLSKWCSESSQAVQTIRPSQHKIRLWGKRVVAFSSEMGEKRGAAKNIIGHPTLHPHYDSYGMHLKRTWAPKNVGTEEFIEIEYEQYLYVTAVCVYEIFNAGAISRISLRDESGQWHVVFTSSDFGTLKRVRIFRPVLKPPTFRSNTLRVDFDQRWCAYTNRPVQIDAVMLEGFENLPCTTKEDEVEHDFTSAATEQASQLVRQFAEKAIASSSHYDRDWSSADEMAGRPNAYPRTLYYPSGATWCAENEGTQFEFAELQYHTAVYVAAVEIYETQNAGGVSRVALRDPSGQWVTVYSNKQVCCLNEARAFVPDIERPMWKTDAVRIEVDQSACVSGLRYTQIDAVVLYGCEETPVATVASAAELVSTYYVVNPMYDDEADDKEERRLVTILQSLQPIEQEKWLRAARKCAKFFNVLRDFAKSEKDDEDFHALSENNERFAQWCYGVYSKLLPRNGETLPLFGKLVVSCHVYLKDHIEDCIRWFNENRNTVSQRPLVHLYAAKGNALCAQGDVEAMLEFYEKARRLVERDFPTHLYARAEVYRLYANSLLYAADWCVPKEKKQQFYAKSLKYFRKELEMLRSLIANDHPYLRRACRNCILVLEEMQRYEEADKLRVKFKLID